MMTDALFWQQGNKSDDPFLEAPLPVAFYHPSLPRPLKTAESEIRLSPQRDHPPEGKENADAADQLTPQEKAFLGRTNTVLAKEMPTRDTPSPPDTSSKFNESWPSSERPSTLVASPAELSAERGKGPVLRDISPSTRAGDNSGGHDESFDFSSLLRRQKEVFDASDDRRPGSQPSEQQQQRDSVLARMMKDGDYICCSQLSEQQQDSVLARYIHRFRHAAPQSRRERVSVGAAKDLWWMSPPTRDTSSTSSVQTGHSPNPLGIQQRDLIGRRDSSDLSSSGAPSGMKLIRGPRDRATLPNQLKSRDHVTSSDSTDPETMLLQQKAQQLLELSESSLLSDPLVSSEGVGTSSPSLPSSVGRPVYVPPEISPIREAEPSGPTRVPGPGSHRAPKPTKPEDDILYQWRLRRKMELAKNHTGPQDKLGEPSLAALRSRLLEGNTPSKRCHPRNDRDAVQLVRATGTDPIPQAASTQTCQITGSDNRPRHITKDADTACGALDGAPRSTAGKQNDSCRHSMRHETYGSDPPIAQPVASASERPACDIPPHLHMSCDIIPCPHGNRLHHHDTDQNKVGPSGRVRRPDDGRLSNQIERNHGTGKNDYPSADDRGHYHCSNLLDHRTLRSDGQTDWEHSENESGHGNESRSGKRIDQNLRIQMQNPPGEHFSSKRGRHSGFQDNHDPVAWHQREAMESSLVKRAEAGNDRVTQENGIKEVDVQKSRKKGMTRSEGRKCSMDARDIEKREILLASSSRSSDTEPFTDVSSDDLDDGLSLRQPPTRPQDIVRSTVRQVVAKTMFGPDAPEASTSQTTGVPQEETGNNPEAHSSGSSEVGHTDTSDGEEFADDELLQMLRKKRALYEKQLEQIDAIFLEKQGL